jgi:Predicted membrane protein (DUF2232)
MMQIVLVGVGAGTAAALLFTSIASGSALSLVLVNVAPLPILIAALGWSHWAGLIAAIVAALASGLVWGPVVLVAFLFGAGLPAWWIGYLTLLARPAAGPGAAGLEWYPIGRVVLWTAILGTLSVVVAIPFIGTDEQSFRHGLRASFERLLRILMQTPLDAKLELPGGRDPERVLDFLATVFPSAAAVSSTIVNLVDLYLAARIVRLSGRLQRPWPDLSTMTFPSFAPALLAVTLAGTFLAGLIGIVLGALTASLLLAYAVLGFAVLHAITRGMDSRPVVLAGIYVAVLVFNGLALIMSLLGLAETAFNLRARIARKRGPPAARP